MRIILVTEIAPCTTFNMYQHEQSVNVVVIIVCQDICKEGLTSSLGLRQIKQYIS